MDGVVGFSISLVGGFVGGGVGGAGDGNDDEVVVGKRYKKRMDGGERPVDELSKGVVGDAGVFDDVVEEVLAADAEGDVGECVCGHGCFCGVSGDHFSFGGCQFNG